MNLARTCTVKFLKSHKILCSVTLDASTLCLLHISSADVDIERRVQALKGCRFCGHSYACAGRTEGKGKIDMGHKIPVARGTR